MGPGQWLVLGTMTLIHLTQLYFVYIIIHKRMKLLVVAVHVGVVIIVSPYLWTWLIQKHNF